MSKRLFLNLVFCFCSAFHLIGAQDRPNIVWIVTEDNSAKWLKLYDENGASMPNVERLAAQGVVFNNAFSCAPVCSVARSTIISGSYVPRLGAQFHRRHDPVSLPEGLKMFPYYVRETGYYTTNCYKQDYNFTKEDTQGVWDSSGKKADYRNREPGQPFFHVQNYHTTHEGQLFFKKTNKRTSTDPNAMVVAPHHVDDEVFRYTYAAYHDRHKKVDAEIGEFLAKLEEDGVMDDTIIFFYSDHGGVLPRSKGYVYNTGLQVPMVVYIPKNWQHLFPAKAGERLNGFVEFVDLSATVLNLLDLDVPEQMDGEPFLGKGVVREELESRDTMFAYGDRFDEKYDLVRTFRKGNFKYNRNYQPYLYDLINADYRYKQLAYRHLRDLHKAGSLNAAQELAFQPNPPESLYDLEADPYEVNNLADDPRYQEKLLELRGLLQQQVKSMPDLGFIPESVILREARQNPVAYGQANKELIHQLVNIADLSLGSFEQAQPILQRALTSQEPLHRYWGLMVCSGFGTEAVAFYEEAKKIAKSDSDILVRVRAAEFLGLTGQMDPGPTLEAALTAVTDDVDALIILNIVTLFHDMGITCSIDLSKFADRPWEKRNKSHTQVSLKYLTQ